MIQRLRETSVLRLLQAEAGGSGWDFVARVYLSWLREHPARLPELAGLVLAMARADRRRERQASAHGIPIPINLVVSPTSDCNMDCPACGTLSRRSPDRSLSPGGMANILKQCRELGICRLTLVGGEPLMYEHLEPLLGDHPDLHFTVFTNGRLMDDRRARGFAGLNNVTFMINAGATNSAESATRLEPCLLQAMEQMKRHGLLFGYAVTTTALNHRLFAARATILRLHSLGARVGFFFDYLPGLERDSATDDPLLLGRGERRRLVREVRTLCREQDLFVVCAPEDEERIGGCAAAGRQVLHVGAGGSIDPCPFVPCSPFKLGTHTLLDALGSDFFFQLRSKLERWEALEGTCACRAAGPEFSALAAHHGAAPR